MLNKMNDDELRAIDPLLPKGWFRYPFNTMAEPHKRVRTINSWRIKDGPHAANLMKRASLHAIDRFFMQIRRLIMMLERPISTPSNDGRVWRGYSARSEEHTSELQSLMRISYAVFCLKKKKETNM